MKKKLIPISIIAAVQLLASQTVIAESSNVLAKPLFPELPMAEQYTHLANLMTECMVEGVPEANGDKEPIVKFIYSITSVADFESQMIDGYSQLALGHTNTSLRSSSEYQSELERCEVVSQKMGMLVVCNAHDVYMRKILRPDDLTAPLFKKSDSNETDQIISWIENEVPEDEFREKAKSKINLKEGDTIYYFKSSPFSWKNMFGRSGYAIFRNDVFLKKITISMN